MAAGSGDEAHIGGLFKSLNGICFIIACEEGGSYILQLCHTNKKGEMSVMVR